MFVHFYQQTNQQCSKKCYGNGIGIQLRQVHCLANNGTIVQKSHCKNLPRLEKYVCNNKAAQATCHLLTIKIFYQKKSVYYIVSSLVSF